MPDYLLVRKYRRGFVAITNQQASDFAVFPSFLLEHLRDFLPFPSLSPQDSQMFIKKAPTEAGA